MIYLTYAFGNNKNSQIKEEIRNSTKYNIDIVEKIKFPFQNNEHPRSHIFSVISSKPMHNNIFALSAVLDCI
jgi:hypothetical protein